MSVNPVNSDGITKMVTQSKTSHWCEFTKTWPYPEICITCGEEAPVLYEVWVLFRTSIFLQLFRAIYRKSTFDPRYYIALLHIGVIAHHI